MKRETCPFCGHRFIANNTEKRIYCPGCNRKYEKLDSIE